jgi:superfamily II DNA or RNA helicase
MRQMGIIMSNLLNKIKSKVSKDLYKSAEKLYNAGVILFCRKITDDNWEFTVCNKNKTLQTIQIKAISRLSEDIDKKTFSNYELAAIIHYYSNNSIVRYKESQQNTPKKELNLDEKECLIQSAELKIFIKGPALHASSTWESCIVSVKILYKGKSYIGSSNKLRQLRFDENKSNSIKLQDFSFQDRQIVRFLTQYAESDGTDFSLKADLMAEFLHCFNESKPIFINDRSIIIHTVSGVLLGLFRNDKSKLYPGIIVEKNVLPLINCNFIAGKCGFWLGYMDEYWWVPIPADTLWIRKFLLSDGLFVDTPDKLNNMPFSVIGFPKKDIQYIPCQPIYYINTSDNNEIILSVKFKYLDKELSMSNQRLGVSQPGFWKRDKLTEDLTASEIKTLGFKLEDGHTGHFSLCELEQKGLFFDIVLREWIENSKHVFFSPDSANIFYKLNSLKLHCTSPKLKNIAWNFNYSLTNESGGKITWNKLLKSVKANRAYVELDNKLIARVPKELSEFVLSFQGIINTIKGKNDSLTVSNAALLYLLEVGENVIDEIPKEWQKKLNMFNASETNVAESKLISFNGVLRGYQAQAVNWMYEMIKKGFNAILADEMGLGKTIQALALINVLKNEKKNNLPCMVVCPTSLVQNWKNEAEHFTPTLKTEVITGSDRLEIINQMNDFDLIITSYALAKRDIDHYKKNILSLLILDEAQHIKNHTTINAKVCKLLNAKNKIVLTGTPLENSSEDVWSIFDFLNPGMLGNNESFKRMYSGIENDLEKQKELSERIAPFILRRHKNKVEQLPEKTEKTLYCELLPTQQVLYDSIRREGRNKFNMFASGKSTRFDVLSSLTRLRQLCCHPELLPDLLRKGESESAKFELLKELLLETLDSGQKTLVFSQFTTLLKIIKRWLDDQGVMYEYLDGGTLNRQGKVDRFNKDKNIKVFLLSLKAGGTGLNLTSASNVIIYDPWWNPTAELQAADRIHRIGQKQPVTTYKLVAKDSIEEKILDLQKRKQGLFNGIIEKSTGIKKISDKDLAFLFEPSG